MLSWVQTTHWVHSVTFTVEGCCNPGHCIRIKLTGVTQWFGWTKDNMCPAGPEHPVFVCFFSILSWIQRASFGFAVPPSKDCTVKYCWMTFMWLNDSFVVVHMSCIILLLFLLLVEGSYPLTLHSLCGWSLWLDESSQQYSWALLQRSNKVVVFWSYTVNLGYIHLHSCRSLTHEWKISMHGLTFITYHNLNFTP